MKLYYNSKKDIWYFISFIFSKTLLEILKLKVKFIILNFNIIFRYSYVKYLCNLLLNSLITTIIRKFGSTERFDFYITDLKVKNDNLYHQKSLWSFNICCCNKNNATLKSNQVKISMLSISQLLCINKRMAKKAIKYFDYDHSLKCMKYNNFFETSDIPEPSIFTYVSKYTSKKELLKK